MKVHNPSFPFDGLAQEQRMLPDAGAEAQVKHETIVCNRGCNLVVVDFLTSKFHHDIGEGKVEANLGRKLPNHVQCNLDYQGKVSSGKPPIL